METEQHNRRHRAKQAGIKASRQERQKKKKALGATTDDKRHNPKAFTFSGGVVSVQRRVQHSLDKATLKEHKAVVDKTPEVAPPYTVVVQGPPGVGKSLLIRCLARHYARRTVGALRGPVTVVASKQRRLTFIECPNDAAGMLDAAKVADIALLLIDAQYGFEMETFEFINMMQTHGMPRVLGVLTHLDTLNNKQTLKRRKKELKNRFWAELYDGAKLFFLSGLRNSKYLNRDVLNLARFLSVQKLRPLQWRASHPYLLALKSDVRQGFGDGQPVGGSAQSDIQPQQEHQLQDQHEGRICVVYGYVRGAVLREGLTVHIPGAGDFPVLSVSKCEDPCPAPCAEEKNETLPLAASAEIAPLGGATAEGTEGTLTKRRRSRAARALKEKERCIYAPDCDIGGMRIDDDAMYIHLPDTKVGFTPKAQLIKEGKDEVNSEGTSSDSESEASESDEEASGSSATTESSSSDTETEEEAEKELEPAIKMVRELQGAEQQLSLQLQSQQMQLLDSSTRCIDRSVPPPRRVVETEASTDQPGHLFFDGDPEELEEERWAVAETDTDTDGSSDIDEPRGTGDRVLQHLSGSRATRNSLADVVYGHPEQGNGAYNTDSRIKSGARPEGQLSLFEDSDGSTSGSEDKEIMESAAQKRGVHRNHVLFGNLPLPATASGLSAEFEWGDSPSEEAAAIYKALGFESEDHGGIESFWTPDFMQALKRRFFITGGWLELEQAKEATKEDSTSAEEVTEEQQRAESTGLKAAIKAFKGSEETLGGFPIGTYVKICIANLPIQWLEGLSLSRPLVLGGLNAGELQCTFMQLRLRKHRWAPRILKSSDPLLFSAGWRRFQSLPIYAMEDRGETRVKYLKYTPEHLHCLAYIYAPALPPSTPLLAISDFRAVASYRIAASGVALQMTPEPKIQKKLKLIGEAKNVFKNTAFIKGMFNSDLEVNRCISAKIQTASGIRGQIKKAVGMDGTFRASFEDKILMSDLIICKTWIKVSPRPFFNPVLDVPAWRRLRSHAEIRQAKQLPLPYKDANLLPYGGPTRVQRKFNPIKIPKQLAMKLPFHARPKLQPVVSRLKKLRGKKLQEEKDMQKPLVSAYDKRVAALLQRLQTIRNAREEQRREKQQEKLKIKMQKNAKVEKEKMRKQTEIRKKRYVKQGKVELGMRKKLRLDANQDD
ncbi:ribosome biogenesis protein BMS1 homolog [Cyclospora cayetanensis]|uniref:Ribosome biogenesis protein BMS1 homolog n=1 Tax=Cyclospora cayetanensis TaxID=88456 RepID=A0A6P6RVY3_9EIME|nr:ribosome biogenesis protein BMS1 homolog [Cyclospora cayetanensis]